MTDQKREMTELKLVWPVNTPSTPVPWVPEVFSRVRRGASSATGRHVFGRRPKTPGTQGTRPATTQKLFCALWLRFIRHSDQLHYQPLFGKISTNSKTGPGRRRKLRLTLYTLAVSGAYSPPPSFFFLEHSRPLYIILLFPH